MKTLRLVSPILAIGLLVFGFVWWSPKMVPSTPAESPVLATRPANIIRLGLVPEHDIFALRKSYQKLAGYLSRKLQQPVEMVTLHTYEAVLFDFKERQIEGAFLGSLVAVLAIRTDRLRNLFSASAWTKSLCSSPTRPIRTEPARFRYTRESPT